MTDFRIRLKNFILGWRILGSAKKKHIFKFFFEILKHVKTINQQSTCFLLHFVTLLFESDWKKFAFLVWRTKNSFFTSRQETYTHKWKTQWLNMTHKMNEPQIKISFLPSRLPSIVYVLCIVLNVSDVLHVLFCVQMRGLGCAFV